MVWWSLNVNEFVLICVWNPNLWSVKSNIYSVIYPVCLNWDSTVLGLCEPLCDKEKI